MPDSDTRRFSRPPGGAGSAQVAGQHAEVRRRVQVDDDRAQGRAGLQIGAIESVDADFLVEALCNPGQAVEHVCRHVQPVRPDPHLRVVGEPRMPGVVSADRIEPPAAGDRIPRLGDGDALVVRPVLDVRPGEVGDDVAVGQLVVDHRRVAGVAGVAWRARPGTRHRRVERERRQWASARLRPDADRRVDRLHVEAQADVTDGIGRMTGTPVVEVEASEVDGRRGHVRRDFRNRRRGRPVLLNAEFRLSGLDDRVRGDLRQRTHVAVELCRRNRSTLADPDVGLRPRPIRSGRPARRLPRRSPQ